LSDAHLSDSLVPALDDLTQSQLELEWLTSVVRGVELGSVLQSTVVVGGDSHTLLWETLTVSSVDLSDLWLAHFILQFFGLISLKISKFLKEGSDFSQYFN
jgi:hypothetical protein